MTSSDNEIFRLSHRAPADLAAERDRAIELLAAHVPMECIREVGSTAVEGVVGKQDLDLLVLVPPGVFTAIRARLDQVLARHSEQWSDDQFQGYVFASPLEVSIQLTVEGCPHDHFDRFLAALRSWPSLREAYNTLKAAYDGRLMSDYRAAKSAFIESVLAEMLERNTSDAGAMERCDGHAARPRV